MKKGTNSAVTAGCHRADRYIERMGEDKYFGQHEAADNDGHTYNDW